MQLAREGRPRRSAGLARQGPQSVRQLMRDEAALKAQLRREEMMLEAELTAEGTACGQSR